ncbi:arsenate reductase ArsC [Candidatus Methylocalor cossyra]|uniref:Arsenate reductase n=1 Tax=Candidatus Methylocalor cossyra TaxID=3108543 RepID=A0ABM9NFE2_9GAMM
MASYNLLFLCTGNSARSILAEALLNQLGAGRLEAYSAGSRPTGTIHPETLATLARHGLSTAGYVSKSWEALANTRIDLVITVCDAAAGEPCPLYLGGVAKAHWGLPDPARVAGSPEAVTAAFEETYAALEKRIQKLLALPLETMGESALAAELQRIGAETP